MQACRDRCRSAILEIIMIGSLWVGRRGAPSKVRFDHVADDGSRLGEIEGGDGRIHLVETLAPAQHFGIDTPALVAHLLHPATFASHLPPFAPTSLLPAP